MFCHKLEKGDVLYENEDAAFAPLEKDVLADDHLLVPGEHHENIFDVPEQVLEELVATAKQVSRVLEETEVSGINVLHASGESAQQSVRHLHFHLVPRREEDGLDLWPDTEYSGEGYEEVYRRMGEIIRDNLRN